MLDRVVANISIFSTLRERCCERNPTKLIVSLNSNKYSKRLIQRISAKKKVHLVKIDRKKHRKQEVKETKISIRVTIEPINYFRRISSEVLDKRRI